MVEAGAQNPRLFLGDDLMVGHVHARPTSDTAGSDAQSQTQKEIESEDKLS